MASNSHPYHPGLCLFISVTVGCTSALASPPEYCVPPLFPPPAEEQGGTSPQAQAPQARIVSMVTGDACAC
eukprot:1154875-Pelagomonas_calceolata.AAC.4